MRKKIVAFFVLTLIAVFSFTSMAELGIVDSMEFQGEEHDLTLQQAIDILLKDNSTIRESELDIDQAKVDSYKIKRQIKKTKSELSDKEEKKLEMSAEFIISNAQRNLEATLESQKSEVESAYYSLLQVLNLVEINRSNMNTAKDLYNKAQKKLELGLVAKQEVLNSELNYIKAENQYKEAQYNVKRAKMSLNIKLGYDVMTAINLTDRLEYMPFGDVSISESVSEALNNRNEVKASQYNYDIQSLEMDIISGKYPDITDQHKEQKVKLERATKDLEITRKSIEMEIRSNYLNILQKQEEIEAGQKSVELAKEALRLSELSYDVGMAVLTDVQQAQTAAQQAKLALSQAILDYNLAVLKFEDSIGVGRTTISM